MWNDWELGVRALLMKPNIYWMDSKTYHRIVVHDDSLTGVSFSQSWEAQLNAARCVLDDITRAQGLTDREQRRCLRSLYLRVKISEGQLRRERCAAGAAANRQLSNSIFRHPTKPLKFLGVMLSNYTAFGGRGAWRIALHAI